MVSASPRWVCEPKTASLANSANSQNTAAVAVRLATATVSAIGQMAEAMAPSGAAAKHQAKNLDLADRHALRQEQARPVLDALKRRIDEVGAAVLPSSALGRAAHCTLALWGRLTRFLDCPELELSINLAENSMRPVALGRKNWIHLGSPQAGPEVAAILSAVETCRRLNIPARGYLGAVLPGLARTSIQRLAELTSAAWAARNR